MSATHLLRFGTVILVGAALAACQGPESGSEPTAPEQTAPSEQSEPGNGENEAVEAQTASGGSMDRSTLEAAVDAARQDLANRSGVTAEDISVIEAREVTWSDGAMGCPEEDMMYTQALVPGYFILLDDGEKRYAYHAGRDGKPFYCPAERSRAPTRNDSPDF